VTISLKRTILFGILAIEAISAIVFLGAFFGYAEKVTTRHAETSIGGAIRSVYQEVDAFFTRTKETTILAERMSNAGILNFENSRQVERYFHETLLIYQHIHGIYFGDDLGSFIFVSREAPGLKPDQFFTRIIRRDGPYRHEAAYFRNHDFSWERGRSIPVGKYDPRGRPWYRQAQSTTEPTWTDPYIFYTSGTPGISISQYVAPNQSGGPAGVIGVDLSLTGVSGFLDSLKISPRGSVFIADGSGRVISHPNMAMIETDEGKRHPHLSEVADLALREAVLASGMRHAAPEDGQPVYVAFDQGGESYNAAYLPMENLNLNWILGAYAPSSDFLEWFDAVKWTAIALTCGLSLFGMLTGWLLWRSVDQRLQLIQAKARQFTGEDAMAFRHARSGLRELQDTENALSMMAETVARRDAETGQLNEALSRIMRAVDRTPIGIVIFIPFDRITYCNAMAQRLLELDSVPPHFDDAFISLIERHARPLGLHLVQTAPTTLADALREGRPWERDLLFHQEHNPEEDDDGEDTCPIYRAMATPLSQGGAISEPLRSWALIIENVTQTRQMEHALIDARDRALAASRAKSMFLANMSHELRTPLNSILGFSDMIMNELYGPIGNDRYADYIRNIAHSGHALLEILSNLLDLTAIESGRMILKRGTVPLVDALSESIDLHRESCKAAGMSISVTCPNDLIVTVDKTKLRQAIGNLVQNAARYATGATELRIIADRAESGWVMITVEDNGIGIPEDRIAAVLEPFHRSVADSQLAAHDGVGLGLPIAKAIAELHGGSLQLGKPDTGSGLRVSLIIPLG